ncbi:MAG: FAD-dependent oxidoreductase [Candidatus Nitricoxidivorans perseverans]|uniref:FAD-dependent oxidoreductase n=1 Tax=Candidatus Nitricoxidivorans perseverans TaxID=2975601 RepID=A0AA49FL92_9PROT|nr:MAG: FAD-dependent oxidoreductase [Candidatus Nitricoxidivorans perseverans]
MTRGIPFSRARADYRPDSDLGPLPELTDPDALLTACHPDHLRGSAVTLTVGANAGDACQRELAGLLQAEASIDEADLAGTPVADCDVLVIGGGGAGCAAALAAAERGARVLLATKLRLGDSNTVMAEGGIQAAIEPDDSAQRHVQDTLRGGHHAGDPELVAAMAEDGPEVIRWLIRQGMQFDQTESGDLATRKAGGMSAARIVHCRDYTGLEMMRVLREAVIQHRSIEVLEQHPAVELLSNELGQKCVGAVLRSLTDERIRMVRTRSVILATGGLGRLHLNGFPTSNHLGATGDGLVLAYRIGARLREIDSFQYHPTGLVNPAHLSGKLVTEGVRAAGALLVNGEGRRFIDELLPRDVVCAAILRECREGRGIRVDEGNGGDGGGREGRVGVWLDTPRLERANPGLLEQQFPKLLARTRVSNIDPRIEPLLVHPTLHYQNGGVVTGVDGATTVPGLYAVGEVSGGVHGRNRIMGNALLEIISFGRRAGAAAVALRDRGPKKVTLEHVNRMRRALTLAGLPLDRRAPQVLPPYATKGIWNR